MSDVKFKFEDLKVYNKAVDFIDLVYKTCTSFPKTKQYALSSQFTRAAVSIALNIAKGSSDTNKQFNRFLQMALDSVNECVVCSTISTRQNYISEETNTQIREKNSRIIKNDY